MQLGHQSRFGSYFVLEEFALDLIRKGYTQVASRDEVGPKQYYIGPEHLAYPALERYVLVWQSGRK